MFAPLKNNQESAAARPAGSTGSAGSIAAGEIQRHFRNNQPILQDGALPRNDDRGNFINSARVAIARGNVGPGMLPAAILRETLAAISSHHSAAVRPASRTRTDAGATPVGPKQARIWWNKNVVDNLDDIIARLDRPRLVLRFYDITGVHPDSGRWNSVFDIDINLDDLGKTVQFWASDRTYAVDLGYIYADGRFLQLARTNSFDLPRDSKGAANPGPASQTILRRRGAKIDRLTQPDAHAHAWAARRHDQSDRDIEAELLVHMLYRSFLQEGPRALRRSPGIARRDSDTLRSEYNRRDSERRRRTAATTSQPDAAAGTNFLVTRLDDALVTAVTKPVLSYHPVPAALVQTGIGHAVVHAIRHHPASAADFLWHHGLLQAIRQNHRVTSIRPGQMDGSDDSPRHEDLPAPAAAAAINLMPTTQSLVRMVPDGMEDAMHPLTFLASPVFEAARNLRQSLLNLGALAGPAQEAEPVLDARLAGDMDEDSDSNDDLADEAIYRKDPHGDSIFGGSEAKRMAKAGVRITRMALTLEGRMRPGARLKVAGKLVYADADGHFQLECVLSGKRASIPMRAGTSINGEAASLINVEWEKRAGREKKKVF